MRIILLILSFPFFLPAMQLPHKQQQANDKYLEERLRNMLPSDQVIYFLENMPRLLAGRHRFHNPLNIYLANDYTVALHYNPDNRDRVRVYRTNSTHVSRPSYQKVSSGSDDVEVTATKFVELLRKLNSRSKTID